MATVKTYVILSAFLILFVAKCSAEDASITQQVQQFMKQMRLNIREGWKAFTKTMQPHVDKYLTPYLQGFYTFTDETSKELFGMEAAKLPRHAEKNTPEIVTAVLTSFWLILALVVAVMSGAGSSLYISAFLFLLYGIFGASWCLKRVIYTSGFVLYLFNVMANNPVATACTLISVYIIRRLFIRHSRDLTIRELNHATYALNAKVNEIDERLDNLDSRVEEISHQLDRK